MSITVRKLSTTGDFSFGNSALDLISNTPQAVAQVVQTSLLLWLGEWYLDNSLGMPWIEGVLGKHSQSTADITVQDYILNVQDVESISDFTSTNDQDLRLYTGEVTINTAYGETAVQIANSSLF
jgi:hypothetical protein